MSKTTFVTLWIVFTSCTMNFEETTIEGNSNKVEDAEKSAATSDIKAKADVPLMDL